MYIIKFDFFGQFNRSKILKRGSSWIWSDDISEISFSPNKGSRHIPNCVKLVAQ